MLCSRQCINIILSIIKYNHWIPQETKEKATTKYLKKTDA